MRAQKRSKRALALLLSALLVGLVAPASDASPQPGPHASIILTGKGSTYVDIKLTRKITPDPEMMEITTDGTYAGYLITERAGELVRLVGGSLAIPKFTKETGKVSEFEIESVALAKKELEPGTYRIQLITDGKATVTIPTDGMDSDLSLRAKRVAHQESHLESLGSGPGDIENRTSIRRRPTTITLALFLQIVENHQASTVQQCLRPRLEDEGRCDQTKDFGSTATFASPGGVGTGWTLSSDFFYIDAGTGPHTVVQAAKQVVTSSRTYSFLLNVNLTAPDYDNFGSAAPDKTFSFPYQIAGVQGQPVCSVYVNSWVGSCDVVVARPTDQSASVKIVDVAGGNTAATVFAGGKFYEICGQMDEPVRVDPGGPVFVDVHAHPTTACPTAHGTTGTVEVSLSSDPA